MKPSVLSITGITALFATQTAPSTQPVLTQAQGWVGVVGGLMTMGFFVVRHLLNERREARLWQQSHTDRQEEGKLRQRIAELETENAKLRER